MKVQNLVCPVLFLLSLACANAQDILRSDHFSIQLDQQGKIVSFTSMKEGLSDTVSFRQDQYAGFAFDGIELHRNEENENFCYEGEKEGIRYYLQYEIETDKLKVKAGVENHTDHMFIPKEGVRLFTGINTYMEKYPDWDNIYFPTMQRCERTHFMSCYLTPTGKALILGSPDPIAAWSNEYETKEKKTDKGNLQIGLHRIKTTSLYLLHRLPLPERHPQDLYKLAPGTKREITLYLSPIQETSSQHIYEMLHHMTQAPVLSANLYTLAEGETFQGDLFCDMPILAEVRTPRNEVHSLKLEQDGEEHFKWNYHVLSGTGIYTLTVMNPIGQISELKIYVRPACSHYLELARKEGLRSQPTSTHHAECFYPFYTYFLAAKNVPSQQEDEEARHVFDSLFPILYDRQAGEMRNGKARLQDAATMAGILSDRYQLTGVEDDLIQASRLTDYLLSCQGTDGALYVPDKHIHYSSVIYPLKSMMEVMDEENILARHSEKWKRKFLQHQRAVLCAIDNLAESGDNIGTEGQMTFEDGMISCSITQLALAALKFPDAVNRQSYIDQAVHLYEKHRCLTQQLIPDCRMNGATLRFWEYQYAVNLMHNAFNSPCGWSAWKLYGAWYLYLLTGEKTYLQEYLNGIGSALQLMDIETGELRFSFLPDPYIDAQQFTETPAGSKEPVLNRVIVGEQYISQTSSWHNQAPHAWRPTKFGIDNFVHEVIKCMSETLLENAYIIEDEKGLHGINCHLVQEGDSIQVDFSDTSVRYLHVNLLRDHSFKIGSQKIEASAGFRWITATPTAISPY